MMMGPVELSDEAITITIPLTNLHNFVKITFAMAGYGWDKYCDHFKITDPKAFAKDIYFELRRENEDGTTILDTMIDKAILNAIEQGAQGIEFEENKIEEKGKRLYDEYVNNGPIHSNRMPCWNELSLEEREQWRTEATQIAPKDF